MATHSSQIWWNLDQWCGCGGVGGDDDGGVGVGGGVGGGGAGPPEQLAETCQRKIILLEKHDILINHSRTSNNV